MKTTAYRQIALAVLLTALETTGSAFADTLDSQDASITNDVFETVRGSVEINQAAGSTNVQGNVAIIGGGGPITVHGLQATGATSVSGGSASIRDNTFSDVVGLVQINQGAGSGNAQGNVAIVRIGASAASLSDDALADAMPVQSTSVTVPRNNTTKDSVGTSGNAFAHVNGVVQINQTAGSGNATANGFLLQTTGVPHS